METDKTSSLKQEPMPFVQQHQQQQRYSRLSESAAIVLCMSRARRLSGIWYKAVSHLRTGKRNKKEKKRTLLPADYARLREARDTATDMTEPELADVIANLLKKILKEVADPAEGREAFTRAWLGVDDGDDCVLTLPDAKGKMKRIDGLRGSDKVWRLDTLVAMLYYGVPMDSTDTGLLVHRCDRDLCVNPGHLCFQCSPATMAVAMEMLRVGGCRFDATSESDRAAKEMRHFQFASPFPIEVIRKEMSATMPIPARVLDRYPVSGEDAALLRSEHPQLWAAYRDLLSRPSPLAACPSRPQSHIGFAPNCGAGSIGSGFRPIRDPVSNGSASATGAAAALAAATSGSSATRRRPAPAAPVAANLSSSFSTTSATDLRMPPKKRRPVSSIDFAATPSRLTAFQPISHPVSSWFAAQQQQQQDSDSFSVAEEDEVAAITQPSSFYHSPLSQPSSSDDSAAPATSTAAAAAAAASCGVGSIGVGGPLQQLAMAALHSLRSSPYCQSPIAPELFAPIPFCNAAANPAVSAATTSAAAAAAAAAAIAAGVMAPLPRPRPLLPPGSLSSSPLPTLGDHLSASNSFSIGGGGDGLFRPILPAASMPDAGLQGSDAPNGLRMLLEMRQQQQQQQVSGLSSDAAAFKDRLERFERLLRAAGGGHSIVPSTSSATSAATAAALL